ncbi:hypothetical protein DM02DRAFT_49016 [Periconia macrospinosa]|uniref:Uncharacterized protein n=1 Tax=Periconia macrospinosa TaxID=97972 RepID=A0A2V1DJS6_9PLEO|nr:hypothetical protein DM02DRAFT_49016 [Periconia macrospinosa]
MEINGRIARVDYSCWDAAAFTFSFSIASINALPPFILRFRRNMGNKQKSPPLQKQNTYIHFNRTSKSIPQSSPKGKTNQKQKKSPPLPPPSIRHIHYNLTLPIQPCILTTKPSSIISFTFLPTEQRTSAHRRYPSVAVRCGAVPLPIIMYVPMLLNTNTHICACVCVEILTLPYLTTSHLTFFYYFQPASQPASHRRCTLGTYVPKVQ